MKNQPLEVSAAEVSLAIADLQMELAKVWDETIGKRLNLDSKLRRWATIRREHAYQVLARWPVSLGGTIPDDMYEGWVRNRHSK